MHSSWARKIRCPLLSSRNRSSAPSTTRATTSGATRAGRREQPIGWQRLPLPQAHQPWRHPPLDRTRRRPPQHAATWSRSKDRGGRRRAAGRGPVAALSPARRARGRDGGKIAREPPATAHGCRVYNCGHLNGLVRLTFGSCLTPARAPIVCLVPIVFAKIRAGPPRRRHSDNA
jgi:hypothetical protein